MKIIKKDCESKQKLKLKNYLMNKTIKKREYRRTRSQNMSEENKQRPKNYCKAKKST